MNRELTPFISIIIAVFNSKATLLQCIDSVAQQTYPNKELIIIDGGSKDGTVVLLEEHCNKFSYWVSEPDRGIYNAWNKGLAQAKGEWICFLGADDYFWDSTVLERMAVQLEMLPANIRVAYGQIMLINDDGQSLRPLGESWSQLKKSFKQHMNIPHVGTMHRRSLFEQHGKFDESFRIAGDYEFLLRELITGDAAFIPNIMTAGQRLGGISTNTANAERIYQEVIRAQWMHGLLITSKYLYKYLLMLLLPIKRKVFFDPLRNKLFDRLRRIRIINILYRLINIIWHLKSHENRKKLASVLREYMRFAEQSRLFSNSSESPYKDEQPGYEIRPKILLVTHEFSRSGAPFAVLYLARSLFTLYGVNPVIIAPMDGPLREEFEREGYRTIIDPMLFSYDHYSQDVCDFVSGFDRIIVTSLASHGFIRHFRGIGKKLSWWIHETDAGFEAVVNMNADLPLLFAACESIWLGSPLCFPLALQYGASQDKLHLLLYGCPDTFLPHRLHKSGKQIFSIIGAVDYRKGQDIFIDAIKLLPDALRCKAIFRIIGSPILSRTGLAFYKEMHVRGDHIPEVEFIKNMPFDELQEFYAESNVFVSASRDDPMPIVITQGLMHSKVCICSSVIGQAQLLEDKKNSLIFINGSAEALSIKMAWIIQNPDELLALGTAGRAIYEKYFLMSSFATNLELLVHDC